MNWQTKKTIDFLLPVAGCAVVVYYVFRAKKDWKFVAAAAILSFLILYIVVSQITRQIYNRAPRQVKTVKDVSLAACKDFDGASLVQAIYEDYDAGFFSMLFGHTGDSSAYSRILALSNCELIALYNQWNKRYYNTTKKSLYGAFAYMGENGTLRGMVNGNLIEAVKDRMLTLNLT